MLHTSPEFSMKKLLAAGEPRIFQLCHVFRNGERSPLHHPEFSMLEWYRAEADYQDLIRDCQELLSAAACSCGIEWFRFQNKKADPGAPWQIVTVPEVFWEWARIDLLATLDGQPEPSPAPLAAAMQAVGMSPHPGDRWEDLFFRVMLEKIEPRLGVGAPAILKDYPLPLAALARPKPGQPWLAERFEVYVCGVELANGFSELTDPIVQRDRFEMDMKIKEQLYKERYPVDEDFLAALHFGLPPCAGIALGFDRLAMLITGAADIREVLWAPVMV
jgi:lysyl-tRNA synthetase class 2